MRNALTKVLLAAAVACMMLASLTACGENGNNVSPSDIKTDISTSCYRELLLNYDYGDETTYVIGHKVPDADTVTSAMAYAYLLNEIGIKAQPAMSGELNKETVYAFNELGITAPEIVDNAEGKQFVLVDHSEYAQTIDGMDKGKIVGIVDHHGIGDVTVSELINVRSAPAGATASLVYLAYRECGVEIPKDMARVMLVGIVSDTHNMGRSVTALDKTAYDELKKIGEVKDTEKLYVGMAEAAMSYGDMTDKEIYFSDYKEYKIGGKTFGMTSLDAFGEDKTRDLTDRMYKVMEENYAELGLDMLFAKVSNGNEEADENMMYMVGYGDGAVELLEETFHCYDGEKFFVFKESLSRKKEIIPAMTKVLENKN